MTTIETMAPARKLRREFLTEVDWGKVKDPATKARELLDKVDAFFDNDEGLISGRAIEALHKEGFPRRAQPSMDFTAYQSMLERSQDRVSLIQCALLSIANSICAYEAEDERDQMIAGVLQYRRVFGHCECCQQKNILQAC